MAIFDHEIRLESIWDDGFGELMVNVTLDFTDAFGERQTYKFPFNDMSDTFPRDRIKVAGTAATGARISSGAVIRVRGSNVDLISGADILTCRWIDDEMPEYAEIVNFLESINPLTSESRLLATRRVCEHPELVSINVLVLREDGDITNPQHVEHINPFTMRESF